MKQLSLDSLLLAAAAISPKHPESPAGPAAALSLNRFQVSSYPSTSHNFQLPASLHANPFLFSSVFINSRTSSERS